MLDLKQLANRLVEQLHTKQPDCAESVFIEPVDAYRSPERFQREVSTLFRRYPVFGGWSAQLPKPNTFRVVDIAGASILLTRDEAGALRAFHNACRHRGMPLASGEGCGGRFVCPFHAWTYDTRGSLIALPFREGFPGITAKTHSLAPVQVAEKHGLIFLRVEGEKPIDVDAHLAGLGEEFARFGWNSWRAGNARGRSVDVNWKLIVDGFCEGYHFPVVHPTTLGSIVVPQTHVVDQFGPHIRELFANVGTKAIAQLPAADRKEPELGADLALIYLVCPNLVLIGLHRFGWQAISVWPGRTIGETVIRDDRMMGDVLGQEERVALEHHFEFNWRNVINEEDVPLAIGAWDAIKAGAVPEFVFGRNELPLQLLHRTYREMIDSGASVEASEGMAAA